MSRLGPKPHLACVASSSAPARAALTDLATRYDLVDPGDCDVIVALGGDGLLLHTIHEHLQLGRPIFGMNRGTIGFLMNQYRPDDLLERVVAATPISVHPLRMAATYAGGRRSHALAFNEVAVTRLSAHSANLRLSIDGMERMAKFVGDGLIVATAAGSTAYNLSAHGPIIPLGSNLLAVTPVSPFRPRRWRGALVPHTAEIVVENLDADKRPLAATADFHELFHVVSVTIREDPSTAVQLLFDADHSLEERIISEQGRPQRPLHPRPRQGRPDRRAHRPGLRRPHPQSRRLRRLGPAADHPQPADPHLPARPPHRGPLRPPAARPGPPQPAPGRSHLQRPAAGRVLRPGRGRHRLRPGHLHPGVRRPGDPPRRHHPADQRRVRPPHVGLLRRPPPGEFPHTVQLAAELARISTDDQFQFGIRTFLAGLQA